ncbi:hypothetical protein FE257_005389 [Aspergillus nanangensis]|uniref:2-dehydropantoate 2-reductase n=1 Tax=Aspergillus nanangensis TaxID=2582783 RepID=A0AAD4GWT0_ASPNN|nr:hypothetical protein FE257_005389 [Aspergillus nanangensis]
MTRNGASQEKRRVLVVGGGGVGTMACVALEKSNMASVTVVLRSNFNKVVQDGFEIESVDHGKLTAWRPSAVVNTVPQSDPTKPFDYVLVTMKNIPELTDIPKIIAPAITPGHTTIVLLQNGLYIEPPIVKAFPQNILLSGASYIGAHERNAQVVHDDHDHFHLGAFHNPTFDRSAERVKLDDFASVYNGSKVVEAEIVDDIVLYRWRKVLWNGIFNPMCAITQLDSAMVRRAGGEYSVIRPGMAEMAAIAKADGYDLGENIVDVMIDSTPIELAFRPSMLVDVDKGNPMEAEVILGNALRVARKRGVQTPILDNTYRFLKLVQARLLIARGSIAQPTGLPTKDFI